MKAILCLGDSNSLGYSPYPGFDRRKSWPSLYPNHLPEPAQVQVDAACGRFFLDPFALNGQDGRGRLALHARKGRFDRLILQLGSNDLMAGEIGADALADAMQAALQDFQQQQTESDLIVLLPAFQDAGAASFWGDWGYDDLKEKSARFARRMQAGLTAGDNIQLLDCRPFLAGSPDGVHFSPAGHDGLARALALLSQ